MGRETLNKKVIAAFDFDGTITKRDSLPVFLFHSTGRFKFILNCIQSLPSLLLFKLKFINNDTAKEKLIKIFFSGVDENNFNLICSDFSKNIREMVNPLAMEKIKWHQKMNHEVIIISASVENWIKPWANENQIKTILSTKLCVKDGLLTGKLYSKNCHGQEKVNRLLEKYPNREEYVLFAYGDSRGDKELLNIAEHSFYRKF